MRVLTLLAALALGATACGTSPVPSGDRPSGQAASSRPSAHQTGDQGAGGQGASSRPAARSGGDCAHEPAPAELPTWARAGFTDGVRMRYVIGDGGQIAAVLFGHPLSAPPSDDHNNKILWVPRQIDGPSGPLTIEGRLDGTDTTVTRTLRDGPGPSIVDLPRPGCWRLTLSWDGHVDTLAVHYHRPA